MIRIISLVPSITELLFALGLGPQVVGRTGFCIHPPKGVADIPKVGGTKDLRLARIQALAPTHVIVNVDENRLEDVAALRQLGAEVVVTHPCSPQDNLALLQQMVDCFGTEQPQVRIEAERLAQRLQTELAACRARAWTPRRVLYLIWRDPWMAVARDTYIARMLAEVGWSTWPPVDGGDRGAARYPTLTGQEPWLLAVEDVLLSSEPYRFDATHFDAAQALCPNARVRLIDGEAVSWYGPRAADGLARLRAMALS